MRPSLDGDSKNRPRFRGLAPLLEDAEPSQIGQVPNFDYQPALGAGATGFDSTNTRPRRDKAGQKAKPGTPKKPLNAAQTAAAQPDATAPQAAAVARARSHDRRPVQPSTAGSAASTTAAPARRYLLPDDTPFDPVGVQVGAFVLRPAVELTRGYDTNAARTSNGTGSWFSVVAPELKLNSNWQRHELTADLRGSYTTYDRVSSLNRPNVDSKVTGRVDVTNNTRLDLEGHVLVGTDFLGSPNIQANLAKLPIFETFGGTAGIGQRFNRLEVVLKGGADRTVYQASTFTNGSTESNDDRNYNRPNVDLRTNYELTPGVKPYLEFGADTRLHDLAVDRFGQQRDSDGRFAKAGSSFEFSRIFTGDVAIGYLTRSYKDPRLPDIAGLTVDSSLTWLATALTTVKLTAATTVNETTLAGISGVFSRDITLQVEHAFRRWLSVTASFTRGFDNYVGSTRNDARYVASAVLLYKLTRDLQLKTEYRREWRHSNTPGNDFVADVVLFGLRLQR